MSRRACGLGALGVLLFTSAGASAERAVDAWTAPPECPWLERVEARIAELAPGASFRARANIRITRADAGQSAYRAELEIPSPDGGTRQRVLTAETCELAVETVAVVFVASQAEVARSEETATERPAPGSPPDADKPPRSPRTGRAFWVAARPVVDHGLLPETAFGGALDVGAGTDTIRAEVRLGALAPTVGSTPLGATGEIYALVADAALCAARSFGDVRVGGCAGLTAALLRGQGLDVESARDEDRLVPAPKLGVDVRWPARGRIAARLDATGRVALARPAFVVINDGPLHQPSPFSVQLAVGPEMRF